MAAGGKRSDWQTGAARRHSLHRKVELSRCAAGGGERGLHESGSVPFGRAVSLTQGHPARPMHINYPSITQFQQLVELKDYRKPTKKEYIRYVRERVRVTLSISPPAPGIESDGSGAERKGGGLDDWMLAVVLLRKSRGFLAVGPLGHCRRPEK